MRSELPDLTRNARFHHIVVEDSREDIFTACSEPLGSYQEAIEVASRIYREGKQVAPLYLLEGEPYIPVLGEGWAIHGYTDDLGHDPGY